MIDLHCHLLPGIDDGPKTLDMALELCRVASSNGIERAVATPHITPGRYDNTLDSIKHTYTQFKAALIAADISLDLSFAAEVRLDPIIMQMVNEDTLPILGHYEDDRIILLEFPHEDIPPGAQELVDWLMKRNIRPMIAHPERNRAVLNKFKKIEPFVKAGCLLQVTAGSLAGVFGDAPMKCARKLLKKGWVSILASDAHNLHARQPDIEPGRLVAAKIVGEQESWLMVKDRPAQIAAHHFQS